LPLGAQGMTVRLSTPRSCATEPRRPFPTVPDRWNGRPIPKFARTLEFSGSGLWYSGEALARL
jgi:hypothetical protein